MTIIVFFVAFYVFLWLYGFLTQLSARVGPGFRRIESNLVSVDDVPGDLRLQLDKPGLDLDMYGFTLSHYEKRTEVYDSISTPRFVAVFVNRVHKSFIEIANSYSPDASLPCTLKFVTCYNEAQLVTFNGDARHLVHGCTEFIADDCISNSSADVWDSHRARVAAYESSETGERLLLDAGDYARRACFGWSEYLGFLTRTGQATESDGVVHYRTWAGVKHVRKLQVAMREIARFRHKELGDIDKETAPDIAVLEADAFDRFTQASEDFRFAGHVKLILFLLSLVGFALLFGLTFSWGIVWMLVPILLFHELGHLVAMWFFGYRDFQILFGPLGAMVTGKKDQELPLQQVIIYLAGPLPGLLLALVLIALIPEFGDWLYEAIMMLFIINYLNLLPFPPLDGGQVVNVVLLDRAPRVQIVVKLLMLLLFGFVAFLIEGPVMIVVSVLMVVLLWQDIKQYRLLTSLPVQSLRNTPEPGRVQAVFQALTGKRWLFPEKLNIAKLIVHKLTYRAPSLPQSAFALLLYMAALVGPVYLGVYALSNVSQSADSFAYSDDAQMASSDYWEEQVAAATTPEERIEVMITAGNMMASYDQPAEAEAYLQNVMTLSLETADSESFNYAAQTMISTRFSSGGFAGAEQYINMLEQQSLLDDDILPSVLEQMALYSDEPRSEHYLHRLDSIADNTGDNGLKSRTLGMYADRLLAVGSQHLAEELLQAATVLDLPPDSWQRESAVRALAHFYVEQRRYDDALAQYSIMVADSELNTIWISDMAWVALMAGDQEKALQLQQQSRDAHEESEREFASYVPWYLRWFYDMGERPGFDDIQTSISFDLAMANVADDHQALDRHMARLRSSLSDSGYSYEQFVADKQALVDGSGGFHAQRAQLLLNGITIAEGQATASYP